MTVSKMIITRAATMPGEHGVKNGSTSRLAASNFSVTIHQT